MGAKKNGSAVKSNGYSFRGPRFNSQHPQDSSQPHITPVPEESVSSSGLCGAPGMHMTDMYTDIHAIKTATQILKNE